MKILFIFLIFSFVPLSLTFAESSLGLIDQPQTFPWTVGLTPSALEEAGGLPAGKLRLQTSILWFNTFRQWGLEPEVEQRVDMEGLLPTVSAAWSPVEGWEVRAQIQGWILGGGFMDGFLDSFHGLLRSPGQGRDAVANNQFEDLLAGDFDLKTPASGLTQFSLGLRGFFGPWSWWTWVKPPLPQASLDWGWTKSWGGGSSVGWGDRWPGLWGEWELGYGTEISLITISNDTAFPGQSSSWTFQWGGYVTMGISHEGRFLVQGNSTLVPRQGTGYLSQSAGLLTMGWQSPITKNWAWEAAVTEEFMTWATMEVGFQTGIIWNP